MIKEMTQFYASMVDDTENPPTTKRFYSSCRPMSCEQSHDLYNPIRDLAAAWDATKILLYYDEKRRKTHHPCDENDDAPPDAFEFSILEDAVKQTLQSYHTTFCTNLSSSHSYSSNFMQVSSSSAPPPPPLMLTNLPESSNVGHSAMVILAGNNALRLSLLSVDDIPLDGLLRGILSMQRSDGAFITTFANQGEGDVETGINFYPGEAMVALMDTHRLSYDMPHIIHPSTRTALIPTMMRALAFYSRYHSEASPDVNYNIWQIQAFSRLHRVLQHDKDSKQHGTDDCAVVAEYVLTLCQGICDSPVWKYELVRGRSFYPNLQTLEIACGLDALVDGIAVVVIASTNIKKDKQRENDAANRNPRDQLHRLQRGVHHAVDFLDWSIDRVPRDARMGRGGLGHGGVQVLEQRLDVTGHALSALIKIVDSLSHTKRQQ